MRFSIITGVFNNKELLMSAINSVNSQQGVEIEHIIMDGGSTDGTVEMIQQQKLPNLIFTSEKDKGIYDALNKGFEKASGDILGIMHSDDIFYSSDILQKIHDQFAKGADIVYADLDYVNRDDVSTVFRHWKSGPFKRFNLKFGWIPPHPSFYMKKSVFNEIGHFDLQFKISADYDYLLRVLVSKKYKLTYLPVTAVKMRVGGDSNKSLKNIIAGSLQDYSIAKKHFMFPLITVISKVVRKIPQLILRK
jgi:glycosyltransferase